MRDLPPSTLKKTEALLAVAIITLATAGVLAAALQPFVEPRWLFLDSTAVGDVRGRCCHVYDGAISNLGIMLWAGAAAVAFFAGFLKLSEGRDARLESMAFLTSAALLLDDAFLLHEAVMPRFGVPQIGTIGALGVLTLAYFYVGRDRLRRSGHLWLLMLSLALFAVSVLIDQVAAGDASFMVVVEDGPKFIGIVCWFLFHLSFFRDQFLGATRAEP